MAINAGGISAFLNLDTGKFDTALAATEGKMNSFGSKVDGMSAKLGKVGGALTKGVTVPLLAIGAGAIKLGMDFEASMSEVQAISGATGADMQKMEELAREMGSTTKFSAKIHWHTVKKLAA